MKGCGIWSKPEELDKPEAEEEKGEGVYSEIVREFLQEVMGCEKKKRGGKHGKKKGISMGEADYCQDQGVHTCIPVFPDAPVKSPYIEHEQGEAQAVGKFS